MKGFDHNAYKYRNKDTDNHQTDRARRREIKRFVEKTRCSHHLWDHLDIDTKHYLIRGFYRDDTINSLSKYIDKISRETTKLDDAIIEYRDAVISALI